MTVRGLVSVGLYPIVGTNPSLIMTAMPYYTYYCNSADYYIKTL